VITKNHLKNGKIILFVKGALRFGPRTSEQVRSLAFDILGGGGGGTVVSFFLFGPIFKKISNQMPKVVIRIFLMSFWSIITTLFVQHSDFAFSKSSQVLFF
jgi:hypothetical protein